MPTANYGWLAIITIQWE